MVNRNPPVKAKPDTFWFSDNILDWQPKVHTKRALERKYKHKRTLIDVRSKRNHVKDLNNLI